MLVFPTLSNDLQDAWDDLEGLQAQNIVTEQVLVMALPHCFSYFQCRNNARRQDNAWPVLQQILIGKYLNTFQILPHYSVFK